VQIALCYFRYDSLGLSYALYIGWAILVFGLLLPSTTRSTLRRRGNVPKGKSFLHTTTVVDTGIYGVIRHPMYLSGIIMSIGMVFITQHWLSIVCGVPWMLLNYASMTSEDHSNVKKFGDRYKRYMKKVPRANIIVGLIRLARRKKSRNNT
jgi:protein-S-isoprenylcysteine O-methyltransferase Ste14